MFKDKKNLIFLIGIFIVATIISLARDGGTTTSIFELGDNTITLKGPNKYSYTMTFEDIDDIALKKDLQLGECIDGGSTRKCSYGVWKNDEFGKYNLCVVKELTSYIIFTEKDGDVTVFNIETNTATEEFYKSFPDFLEKKLAQ
ncbi:MAG: hypothetical protein ACOX75_00800 [Lachnospiraceae bacterium]|jgi:hypothetical protein